MASHPGRRFFSYLITGGLILAAFITLFSAGDGATHAAGSFNTTTTYSFCNPLKSTFGGPAELQGPNPDGGCNTDDYTPGANPDWAFKLSIPSGDYNFSTFAVFVSDGFTIAADADIDDGTVVGGMSNGVNLGLLNGACKNSLWPEFILYDSTTDTTNTVDASAEGTTDRFAVLTDDDDAFFGKADGDSPAVLQYPSFLNTLLDPDLDFPGGPDGPLDPISPHARYTGLSQVPVSGDWIFLTILVFEKTQLSAFANDPDNATNPLARYGRNPTTAGWVHLLVLQDPTETVASVTSITDFCTSIDADAMFLGQVTDTSHGLVNRFTSPAANTGIDGEGTHLLMLNSISVRDTDGDGLENSFDTCPFAANTLPAEDPRQFTGPDLDMLDSVCDPFPAELEGDEDGDGFLNAQDNCPLAANSTQAQAESTTAYILAAPDAGFRTDSLGDACDSENGGSDSVADGGYLHDMNTDAVCISSDPLADEDEDGWCDVSAGADPDDNNSSITGEPNVDTDGDGTANITEIPNGTDPLVDCPIVSGIHDAWPPDFDKNRVINILDVGKVLPPIFGSTSPGPPYTTRADLAPNGVINILDVGKVLPPVFGATCTP